MVTDTERALVRQLQSLPQAYISHFAVHERCASLRCIALGISIDCLCINLHACIEDLGWGCVILRFLMLQVQKCTTRVPHGVPVLDHLPSTCNSMQMSHCFRSAWN